MPLNKACYSSGAISQSVFLGGCSHSSIGKRQVAACEKWAKSGMGSFNSNISSCWLCSCQTKPSVWMWRCTKSKSSPCFFFCRDVEMPLGTYVEETQPKCRSATLDPESVFCFLWLPLMAPFCGVCTNPKPFSLRQWVLPDSEMLPWQIIAVLMIVKRQWWHFQVSLSAIGKAVLEGGHFVLLRARKEPVMHYGKYGKLANQVKPSATRQGLCLFALLGCWVFKT